MNRFALFPIIIALMLSGCVSTKTVTTIDLDEMGTGQPGQLAPYHVTLVDMQELDIRDLEVASDSTSWLSPRTGEKVVVATSTIETISYDILDGGVRMRSTVAPEHFDPAHAVAATATAEATNQHVRSLLSKINRLGAQQTAIVTLTDGRPMKTRHLHIAADSTTWFSAHTAAFKEVSSSDIREIRFTRTVGKASNAGIGLIIGLVGGASIGVVTAGVDLEDCNQLFCEYEQGMKGAGGAVLGGLMGAALGGLIGSTIGAESIEVYRFAAPAPPVVATNAKEQVPNRQ